MTRMKNYIERRGKTMNDSAVLAQRFVPSNIKDINRAAPNHFIDACPLPTLNIDALRQRLCPMPECRCYGVKHELLIPAVHVEPETQYALTSTKEKGQLVGTKLNSVDQVSSIKDYTEIFAALLFAERLEVLRLYERYSLWGAQLNPLENQPRGSFLAPGVADATPPVFVGDLVLVRPLRNVSLPTGHASGPEWTPPYLAIQFNAQVAQIRRSGGTGRGKANDKQSGMAKHCLDITWLEESQKLIMNQTYPEKTYNVRIVPSTKPYERCLTAIAWVNKLPPESANQLLLPNEAPTVADEDEFDASSSKYTSDLNPKQFMFVRLTRARTMQPSMKVIRPPMILTGPAGTGKTKTMLAAIFHILEESSTSRILICTPSHTACDVVTRRLGKFLSKDELWRLIDSQRPIETVPSNVLPFCQQDNENGTFALPKSTEEIYRYRVIVCTCSDAHILWQLGFTNEQLRKRRECFVNFCKDASSGLNLNGEYVGEKSTTPHFTHLFVDEAAQATEPEILIPFSVVVDPSDDVKKVEIGLVGDPRQLAPNIYSKMAASGGLGQSYMERILQRPFNYLSGGWPFMLGSERDDDVPYDMQHQRSSIFLTTNYRGHVSSLMMPSSLFYYDKLTAAVKDHDGSTDKWLESLRSVEALAAPATDLGLQWDEQFRIIQMGGSLWDNGQSPLAFQRQLSWPLHFRAVEGKDTSVSVESFAGSNSWCNQPEAEAVVEIVTTLLHMQNDISSASIGIMSPFRGQVVLIRSLLRAKGLAGINVGTIEDYQAVERDIIVLSLTRSNPNFLRLDVESRAGVFRQAKRTNVAITRAEHLLIVVGDPKLMVQDPIWKQWLWFCLRNGLWYGTSIGPEILEAMGHMTIATFHEGENRSRLREVSEETNSNSIVVMSTLEKTERSSSAKA